MANDRECGTVRATLQGIDSGFFGEFSGNPSLLSRFIESQGQDTKILSIRDQVLSNTGDEGWAIHRYGSLWYRGRVEVP